MTFWLFVFGLAVGSFLNVVALRYDPDRFILNPKIIGGRSRCPRCGHTLTARELVPLVSYIVQGGRCRACRAKISPQYPLIEIASGLIFVLIPAAVLRTPSAFGFSPSPPIFFLFSAIWILAFLAFLLIALIDIRLKLIPDELNLFLAALGIMHLLAVSFRGEEIARGSFLESYAMLFGFSGSPYLNRGVALAAAVLFFGLLIAVTRGRGMGMGDLKLAGALGVLLGWPDVALAIALAFIIGAFAGLIAIAARRKGMKSFLPFGPFLVLGAALVFFFGHEILAGYFKLFSM